MNKKELARETLNILVIILCACLYAFFFKLIVEGRGFLSLGVQGVAVIISRLLSTTLNIKDATSIFYTIVNIALNIPILIFGYRKISKRFVLRTMIFVLVNSIAVSLIPYNLSSILGVSELDDLTSAILIGLISGISCAGVMTYGGCSGGIDIISTYLNLKKGKGVGKYKLIMNIFILFLGFIVFRNVPSIVYTLVYAFVSSIILDRYYNRNKKILLEIVTTKKEEICQFLLEHAHHGCTVFDASGAYTKEGKNVIHTVISWFQLKNMITEIRKIDNKCFIINLNVYNVDGAFYLPPIK